MACTNIFPKNQMNVHKTAPVPLMTYPFSSAAICFSVMFRFSTHPHGILCGPWLSCITRHCPFYVFCPTYNFYSFFTLLLLHLAQLQCCSLLLVSTNFWWFSCHCFCLTKRHCTPPLSSLSIPLTPLFSSLYFALFLCVIYCLMPLRPASLCQFSLAWQ